MTTEQSYGSARSDGESFEEERDEEGMSTSSSSAGGEHHDRSRADTRKPAKDEEDGKQQGSLPAMTSAAAAMATAKPPCTVLPAKKPKAASSTAGKKREDDEEDDDEDVGDAVRRGLEQMKEALEMIPAEEKKAYTEALSRAPKLVEIESNFERYLKFEEFNPWNAAQRVVEYWKVRVELFGEERAFLPLTLTGDGALSEGDLEVLRTGFMMILPNTVHGTPTVFHDRSRLDKAELLDPAKRLRCTFYFLSVLSETTPECMCLTVYCSKTRKSTFDIKLITDGIQYFIKRRVIPLRYPHLHYVMLSTRPVLDFVIPTTVKALEKVGGQKANTVIVHSNQSVDAIQESLRGHGFSLEGLPKVPLGGLYTFGCFRRWVEDRIRVGARTYGTLAPSGHHLHEGTDEDDDDEEDHGTKNGKMAAVVVAGAAGTVVVDETPEEVAARKRREVYAGYARRKRARKRIEAKVLQSEVDRLEKQKDELERTGHDLESRLAQAEHIVAAHEADKLARKNGYASASAAAAAVANYRLTSAAMAAARGESLLGGAPPPLSSSMPGSSPMRRPSTGCGDGVMTGLAPPTSTLCNPLSGGGWYNAPYAAPGGGGGYGAFAPSAAAPLYGGGIVNGTSGAGAPRPLIFLDASAAAAAAAGCGAPIYIATAFPPPGLTYVGMGDNVTAAAPWGGGPSSHHHQPHHVPLSSSSSSSLFGASAAGMASGSPPPPPPPPSPQVSPLPPDAPQVYGR